MRKTTRGRICGALLIMMLPVLGARGFAAAQAAGGSARDAVVATVNGEPITRAEFQREYRRAVDAHAEEGNPVDEASLAPVRRQVIMRLVEDRLLYQESRRRGIRITDQAVADKLAEIRQAFETEAAFEAHLLDEELDLAAYRAAVAQSLAIKALVDQEINQGLTVTEEEMRAFYESRPEVFRQPEKVILRWILLRLEPRADEAARNAAQARAAEIRRRWEAGEDFTVLAREFSEDPGSAPEGLLPEMEQRQVAHFFGPQTWDLAPGQVSPPLTMSLGVCLVRMERRLPGQTLSLAEVRAPLQRYLMKEKAAQAQRRFTRELQQRAEVKLLVD